MYIYVYSLGKEGTERRGHIGESASYALNEGLARGEIYIYVYIYIYMCVYIYIYMYIYIYIYRVITRVRVRG